MAMIFENNDQNWGPTSDAGYAKYRQRTIRRERERRPHLPRDLREGLYSDDLHQLVAKFIQKPTEESIFEIDRIVMAGRREPLPQLIVADGDRAAFESLVCEYKIDKLWMARN